MNTIPRTKNPLVIEVAARYKHLSCDQISALFLSDLSYGPPIGTNEELDRYNEFYGLDVPVFNVRAAEVRCSIRDCPGRGGWVIEQLTGDPTVSQWATLLYVAPRGYKLGKFGAFVPSERMKEQRRRGFNELVGRRPNGNAVDTLARPLRPSEMPAEAYAILGDGFLIRCSSCQAPRFLRVTEANAAAHLANERCGMLRST